MRRPTGDQTPELITTIEGAQAQPSFFHAQPNPLARILYPCNQVFLSLRSRKAADARAIIMFMRRTNGSYQKLRLNGLGENLSIGPVRLKAVQVPIACAKNRFNVAILQNLCSRENKLTAKIHIKDGASKRRCLRQSDRIRRCLYWPEHL